ncbi:hypothetical protein EJV47_10455 [Hymenobacter gummosus]|uniref:DUF306 domain-containing protein n=1 Tax=Hymenobacter gummosus TaxID=1776032 RepID=A0A431U3I9_9BACT|nr:hypothetical protein [Hymenobacter gummosus]RTQ50055.1 hypothetical protein EJV47_10455 [Hymenobacter gummosus]
MRFSSLPVLAALSLLGACQAGQPDTERNPTTQAIAADSTAVGADAIGSINTQQLLPQLAGHWVQQSYLDAVVRTKSPYRVQDSISHIAELLILPGKLTADSLLVGLSLGNHEGGEAALYLRPARHPQALPLHHPDYEQPSNYYELSYAMLGRDSLLRLNLRNRGGKLMSSVAYRRARMPLLAQADDLSAGLQYEVNRLLMAGRYTGRDSVGRAVSARFTPDGKVSGLAGFKTYYVGTDFGAGPENNLDDLTFNSYTKQQRSFTYRFSGDTLRLFALRSDSNHIDLAPARLHYTLVRRR